MTNLTSDQMWDDKIGKSCGIYEGEKNYRLSLGGKTLREETTWKAYT